jgi:Tfp pilus assembly protein PilF
VLFALGRVATHDAGMLQPGPKRRERNKQVRDYFSRAQDAGYHDPLIATALASINPDGSENIAKLSPRQEVDRLLQEGEKHFGQRNFSQAIEEYRQAFNLEPTNYMAALYTGDAYFASGSSPDALVWFDKAAALNPDREVAHRYAGDALLRTGKRPEALQRYLTAIVAEPYNGYPWRALNEYCKAALIKQWTAPANIPMARITEAKGKKELGLPKEFSPFDLIYGTARLSWQEENQAKKFPAGSPYRLTLEEEAFALRATLKSYGELKHSAKAPPEIAAAFEKYGLFLDHLVEIEAAGLLEAHILLVRANADIAEDYPAYRDLHRELLRDYLTRFYLQLR